MQQFLTADVIIVSLNFLQNVTYKAHTDEMRQKTNERVLMQELKDSTATHASTFSKALLSRIFWHRIVCDEFHELGNSNKTKKASAFFLKDLRARFYVGVTGTPQYSTVQQIVSMAQYLDTELPDEPEICAEFLHRFVRRNEPNLELPELSQVCF